MGPAVLARPCLELHSSYSRAVRNRPPCLGLGTIRTTTVGTNFRSSSRHFGTAKDPARHSSRSLHALGTGPRNVCPRVRPANTVSLFTSGISHTSVCPLDSQFSVADETNLYALRLEPERSSSDECPI